MSVERSDEEEFQAGVRRFLLSAASVETLLKTVDLPDDGDLAAGWLRMASELGLQGLLIPEELGGQGLGLDLLAPVLEEMGAALYPGPFLASSVLAVTALLAAPGPSTDRWLQAIASGELMAAVAVDETDLTWDTSESATTAVPSGSGGVSVTGRKIAVIGGAAAGLLVVSGRLGDEPAVFAVELPSEGVVVRPEPALDLTRRLASVDLQSASGEVLAEGRSARDLMTTLRLLAATGLACEQVGVARSCVERTIAYAGTRIQFGREIGSFQAVRHRCADMWGRTQLARAVAGHAAECAADAMAPDAGPNAVRCWAIAAATAQSYCSDVALQVAADSIQLHGGIGFTWELPLHLYFKRAKSAELMFGDAYRHRAVLAKLLAVAA